MKLDLFETLESFFRGVLFFVYNFLVTLFIALRRPMRGPMQLAHSYASGRRRQIGGLTFLFCTICVLLGYTVLTTRGFPDVTTTDLINASFNSTSFWPIVAAAIAGTAAIDASLRLWLGYALSGRSRRRDITIPAIEYGMIWPLLASAASVTAVNGLDSIGVKDWAFSGLATLLLATIGLATWPIAAILICAHRRSTVKSLVQNRRRASGRRLLLRRVAHLTAAIALLILGLSAVLVVNGLIDRSQEGARAAARSPIVAPVVNCVASGSRVHVDAVLWNRSDLPFVLRVDEGALGISTTNEMLFSIARARSPPQDLRHFAPEYTVADFVLRPLNQNETFPVVIPPGGLARLDPMIGTREQPMEPQDRCTLVLIAPGPSAHLTISEPSVIALRRE
jgi:hypothetical protein